MTKILNGYYSDSVNGNTVVVVRNENVWEWATYNGIGGEAVKSGKALSRGKAEAEALKTL